MAGTGGYMRDPGGVSQWNGGRFQPQEMPDAKEDYDRDGGGWKLIFFSLGGVFSMIPVLENRRAVV
jgi:hypothetical protein